MSLTPDEITAAIAELLSLKPLTKSAVASAALTAAQLTPELREHRKALRNRVTAARSKTVRWQKEVSEMLTDRGDAHWRADDWKARGPGANVPDRYPWTWYEAGIGNDAKLMAAKDALANAEANLRATSADLQLFDACHNVQGIDYTEPPPQLDFAAIEAAGYAAAPARHAAAIDRIKALSSRHRCTSTRA